MENLSTFVRTLGNQFIRGKKVFTGIVGLDGVVLDNANSTGTSGQVLSTTGSGVEWITVGSSDVGELNDLTDVVISTVSSGQLLQFDGESWVNWTHDFLTTSATLSSLTDVGNLSPTEGQILVYNSGTGLWVADDMPAMDEVDTLDSVTGRGNTTANSISVGNITSTQIDVPWLEYEGKVTIASTHQKSQGDPTYTFLAFNFGSTDVVTVDEYGYVSGAGFKTSGTTGFLRSDGSVDTSTYLTSFTESQDLNDVTGLGSTTTNSITVGGVSAPTHSSADAMDITADTNGNIQPAQGTPEKLISFNWDTTEVGYIDTDSKITFDGFKTPTGTSAGFLKADGSVDNTTYLSSVTEAQDLDDVTTIGSTTTNSINVGGVTTDYVELDTSITPPEDESQGYIGWDSNWGAPSLFIADSQNIYLGQDSHWYVKNGNASTLAAGTVVMASGAVGASSKIKVDKMVADGTVSSKYIVGIIKYGVATGEFGYAVTQGTIKGIDTSSWSEGDVLWCDPNTDGGLTNVEPSAPNLRLPIAFVVSSGTSGSIAVRITQGNILHELHDVDASSPSNNDLLKYDSTTSTWKNWALPTYDNYEKWVVSDGTNTTDVDSGKTITIEGAGSVSVQNESGNITITGTDTDTTYTAGTGLTLSGTEFSVTANTYAPFSHNHDDRYYTETESDARYARGVTINYSSVDNDPEVDAWYKLFQITDSGSSPVICFLRGYAHSSVTFIVSEGYLGGNAHVQILDYLTSTNNNYKWIKGVRIISNGDVEVLLNGGPTVSLEMSIIGDAVYLNQPRLSTALAADVRDSVTGLTNGMIRAKGNITGANLNISNWDTAYGWGNHAGLYASATHNHDDRYYTETETDTLLSGKADTGHTHEIADITGLQDELDRKLESESDTLDSVTGRGATTTNDITVAGATFNGQTFHNGEVVIPSIGTADNTNREYDSQTIRFTASGWDTNNSIARTVNWNIRNEAVSNIYPDAYLTFYEESPSYNHWKLKLPGRGSGSSYIHPDAALFNGNVSIYQSDTTSLGINLVPAGNSYFTNNVGIGTTSPVTKLDVVGDAYIYDSSVSASGLRIDTGIANLVKLRVGYPGDWANADVQIQSSTTSGLDTGIYLKAGGNVGIGTTSPSYKLDVNGDFRATTIYDNTYANGGSTNWITKKYVRSVGLSGSLIGGAWVHLTRVSISSSYQKAILKFTIHGYDDVSSGTEVIDVAYENGNTAQEKHSCEWYATDNNANLFSEVRSIRSSSSGTSNVYDLYVQMAGDWRDTFTVNLEQWLNGGSVTVMDSNGTADAPAEGSDDKELTSRDWMTANDYIRSNNMVAYSYMYAGSGFEHYGDGGTGLNFPSNDNVSIKTAGSDRLYVNSSGNVGIGTTSPSTNLEVSGETQVITIRTSYPSNSSQRGALLWKDATNITGSIDTRYDGTTVDMHFGSLYNSGYNSTTRLVIKGNGNVGIGTTSPLQKLSVRGIINSDSNNDYYGAWISGNSTAGTESYLGLGPWYSQAGYVKWVDNSRLSIYTYNTGKHVTLQESGGNVGIGTTSPSYKLDVNGSFNASNITATSYSVVAGKTTYKKSFGYIDTTGSAVAGLRGSSNGASAMFTFEMYGGSGQYQKVVYSCQNAGGNWYPYKVIDQGTNNLDVVASANGTTITFTFKATSATQYYSPTVVIEHVGAAIEPSYL